ncbi:MAG TPA: hypothetical protein DIV86_03150 [Alphaproteobacteria bacterium]|nr:hypothetical protein [Alphaproteobacteria bacterium]
MKKLLLAALAASALIPITTLAAEPGEYQDTNWPDDGSGYWGPEFCSEKPDDFEGICMGEPDEFSLTLVQFRLRKESDKSFVDLASAPQAFDFASATAGAELGDFASGATVPAGVYDAMSFVAETDVVIRGSVTLNDGAGPRCRTTSSGVATDSSPAENYTASNNYTPLFEQITSGSDEVEGIQAGPGIEIDYVNSNNQLVHINDTLGGVSFPITVVDGQTLTFDFSMRPVKGIVYEWDGAGNCIGAYSGDMQIAIQATVE